VCYSNHVPQTSLLTMLVYFLDFHATEAHYLLSRSFLYLTHIHFLGPDLHLLKLCTPTVSWKTSLNTEKTLKILVPRNSNALVSHTFSYEIYSFILAA
jgi:hypothetical protein